MTISATGTLVDEFVRFLETADPQQIFDSEVFVDFNVPHWRWQIQGVEQLVLHYKQASPHGARVTRGRCLPTPDGFVMESEYRHDAGGEEILYRSAYIVTTHEGRITQIAVYCSGEWDEATRVRHAAEAPMIRR